MLSDGGIGLVARALERVTSQPPDVTIAADTSLGPDGLDLDSIEVFELVLEVESLAGVELRDDELTAASLETVGSLAELVASRRQA